MTPDELKTLPKGNFVIMKTGTHPIQTKLHLFLDWGITFGEPYIMEEKSNRKVAYADKRVLEENIVHQHDALVVEDSEPPIEPVEKKTGGVAHAKAPTEKVNENGKRRPTLRTYGGEISMSLFGNAYRIDLSHREKVVYMYLLDRSDERGECWPAINTIAKDIKLSRSTVKRAIADLVKFGLLVKEPHYRENGSNSSNRYFLKK